MKATLALVGTLLAAHMAVHAQTPDAACTRDEAYAAEVVTDYLTSWESVYRFYKQFRHCYDGAIAEGTEDKIQLLWANRWQELPRMLAFMKKDAEFKKFIWVVIDSEAFPQDTFDKVLAHATRRCPKEAGEFCKAIKSAGRRRHEA